MKIGAAPSMPTLQITSTHSGNFHQGQTGASYTLTVSNQGGAPTSGAVTVTDVLRAGLTLISMTGANWSCTVAAAQCTSINPLQPNTSYPITVTVNIAANAVTSPPLVNAAIVSGGGAAGSTATDSTTIQGFGISLTSPSQTALAGSPTQLVFPVSVTIAGNFTGPVSLALTGMPNGIINGLSASWYSLPNISPSQVPALGFTVGSATPPGVYVLTITGSAAGAHTRHPPRYSSQFSGRLS